MWNGWRTRIHIQVLKYKPVVSRIVGHGGDYPIGHCEVVTGLGRPKHGMKVMTIMVNMPTYGLQKYERNP